MASRYQMMEELGSAYLHFTRVYYGNHANLSHFSCLPGGSFGTVYKAIDMSTGEIVAVKHVCVRRIVIYSPNSD